MPEEMVTMKWAIEYANQNYQEGLAKGRKEVVMWVKEDIRLTKQNEGVYGKLSINGFNWEAKLKEWCI